MPPKSPSWDVEQYERYKAYRDRPALDLMVQIPGDIAPREVWDLGCGAGEHAALLALRHPQAKVHGLDSSPDMLAAARARSTAVDWALGSIDDFAPALAPDLIFTNAALQWVGDHAVLFPRLVSSLAPGGVFACQMPLSGYEPWHDALRDLAAEPRWAGRMQDVRGLYVASVEDYWRWLSPLAEVDVWKTRYLHVLTGDDPVVEWMKGTGLRPYLARLDGPAESEVFLDAYRERLRRLFPVETDGSTLFDFPRLFILARRTG